MVALGGEMPTYMVGNIKNHYAFKDYNYEKDASPKVRRLVDSAKQKSAKLISFFPGALIKEDYALNKAFDFLDLATKILCLHRDVKIIINQKIRL